MHSSNSYVATSITMSQHSFSAASTSWCRDPSFHVATRSLFRLCYNTVLYYLRFYRDPESLSRQRLVATELDFLLQPCSDVATWLLGVVNICFRNPVFMSRQDSSVFSLIVLSLPNLFYRDRTSLLCVETFVATYKSRLRPRFSLFGSFVCCDIKIHVATSIYLLSSKVCCNVGFLCCDQANQTSKHHLSRLKFSCRDRTSSFSALFCLNQLLHVVRISVATE